MTRLDDLDEYAARWRASQPEPEVDWDAVTQPTQALRARWVPLAAAAAVGILVAGIALAGSTLVRSSGAPAHPVTPPTSSPLAYDVPWVDRAVPPNGGLSPLPASPPPADAPACRADQLATEHAGSQITQDDGISIAFKNTSHSTCLLAGAPNVTAYGTGLSPYRVPTNGPTAPADAPSWNMSPGDTTSLWVANPRACTENQGGTPTAGPRYDRLVVLAPGGGDVTINQVSLHPSCGVFVTHYFRQPPPIRYAPQPFNDLTATMTMPENTRAGQLLTYVVTLTNNTKHPASTSSCPGYIEYGSDGNTNIKATYALNCDSLSSIAAGQSIRFQMRVAVPADAPTGELTLRWALITGPHAPATNGTVAVQAASG